MMPRRYLGLMLSLCGLWAVTTAHAATYGLVIGINDYQHKEKLAGAVNDARGIAQALQATGAQAKDVVVLLDHQASRRGIMDAWQRLVRQAQRGDTLILTYAGHGAQEPERVPGNEADGKDEVLVLAGFHERRNNGERIIDDELQEMFRAAAHLKVIFIADACYSGTLTRGALLPVRTRAISDYGLIAYDPLPLPKPQAASRPEADLPHVTFFSASRENQKTPEVTIDGKAHGALSWAFAKALHGAADRDHDGVLSKGEMEHFVLENVRMHTEYKQHPQVRPRGAATSKLLTIRSEAGPVSPTPPPDAVALRLIGVSTARAADLLQALQRVTAVQDDTTTELVWDVQKAVVLNAVGDIVARLQPNTPGTMQQVVDKWVMLHTVRTLSARDSLRLRIDPGDELHHQGAVLQVSIDGQRHPYLTILNLTADGTVQFLYPVEKFGDALEIPPGQAWRFPPIRVTPPFGAEHLVAISSSVPLRDLHRVVQSLHGKPQAFQLATFIKQQVEDVPYQMGLVGLYTAP